MRFAVIAGGVLLLTAGAWMMVGLNVRPELGGFARQPAELPAEFPAAAGAAAGPDDGDATATADPAGAVRVTFMGVSTLLFDDGETAFMTDGFFSRPRLLSQVRRIAPDSARIDASLARAGVSRLAAVIPLHSHFDHAFDAPMVAARTGALLLGSASTANIGRGYGLPESGIRVAEPGEALAFGRFTVTLIPSVHVPSFIPLEGTIDAPLTPPARATAYRMGGNFSVLVEHDGRAVLVQGGAGFVPGALGGRRAEVVYLGIGLLGRQDDAYREALWREVVEAVGARRVVATHWDDFFRPSSEPLRPLPRLFDDVGRSLRWLERRGEEAGVEVLLPAEWRAVDPFHGLTRATH